MADAAVSTIAFRTFSAVLMLYLACIGTWKLCLMRTLNRTITTHSQRIAAILELVGNMPDPSDPAERVARRARVISIVQDARNDIAEPKWTSIPLR